MPLSRAFVVERLCDGRHARRLFQHDDCVGWEIIKNAYAAVESIDPRRDVDQIDRGAAALRFDSEAAHGFDRVAEQLDANRLRRIRREVA